MKRVRGVIVLTVALVVAACSSSAHQSAPPRPTAPVTVTTVAPSPRENVPSALDDPTAPGLPRPLVDPSEIEPGGPPPDGIPAIDHPTFLRIGDVSTLKPNEPVLALDLGGEHRAYPIEIMVWHEIVNDTVAGTPVTVSYCPLCNSAIAYDRRVASRVLDFGTSGRLYNSALVMYDRQTQSLWSHFTAQAIAGVLTGTNLDTIPVQTVAWEDWRSAHPDGLVLSRRTGFDRDYGHNPYPGYDDTSTAPFLFDKAVDGRLPAKTHVLGALVGSQAIAITQDRLRHDHVVPVDVTGTRLVAFYRPGLTSPLEQASIDAGRDIGATGLFRRDVTGHGTLDFHPDGDAFVDRQTSSRWDILGRATSGPLSGTSLAPVSHVDSFWFAWAAFRPDTTLLTLDGR
jgi:hypothetical protein